MCADCGVNDGDADIDGVRRDQERVAKVNEHLIKISEVAHRLLMESLHPRLQL